jgi:hypothetical protein
VTSPAFSEIPPPIPGLNTRETAIVVWGGGFLLLALSRSDVRHSIGALLKLILTSVWIAGALLGGVAYAAASIFLLIYLGYWEAGMTKVAVLWFVGFALVALVNTKDVDLSYFHRLLVHTSRLQPSWSSLRASTRFRFRLS